MGFVQNSIPVFISVFTLLLFSKTSFSSPKSTDHNFAAWKEWQKEHHETYASKETSYLNATGVQSINGSGTLYLPKTSSRSATKWTTRSTNDFEAKVVMTSDGKATLYRPGQKNKKIGKKKFKWKLKNGTIARLSVDKSNTKSNGKVWAYTFDPDQIKKFSGFRFFPFNRKAVVKAHFTRTPTKTIDFKTYQDDTRQVRIVGKVSFSFEGESFELPAYNWEKGKEKLSYAVFVFTEPSAPKYTYGGARELILEFDKKTGSGNQEVTLDFNRTINFYCAHSPYWHCPVGLDTKISKSFHAGEMLPKSKISSRSSKLN